MQASKIRITNLSDRDITVPWDSVDYTVPAKRSKVFEYAVGMQFMRRERFQQVAVPGGATELVEQLEVEEVTGEVELVEKSALLTHDGIEFASTADLVKYVEEKTTRAVKTHGAEEDGDRPARRTRSAKRHDSETDSNHDGGGEGAGTGDGGGE